MEEIKASQNIDIADIRRLKFASLPQTIKNNWLLIWEDDRTVKSP